MSQLLTLAAAATALQRGELVGIPTETVYGLAANAFDDAAVARVFTAKNRPYFDPLIVHLAAADQAAALCTAIPPAAERLMAACWPGPLTLLLPKSSRVSDLITAGAQRVAVRVPRHPLTLSLLSLLPFPLVAPSANPFGYISPTQAAHVLAQLGPHIAGVLDGGPCDIGVESTIVGFDADAVVIYRDGGVSREALTAILGNDAIRANNQTSKENQPDAPGQLSSHYAPRKPLYFDEIDQGDGALTACLQEFSPEQVGAIAFCAPFPSLPPAHQWILSESGNCAEAAQRLFHGLRLLDAAAIGAIYARAVPDQGLGRAINDRLRRASRR